MTTIFFILWLVSILITCGSAVFLHGALKGARKRAELAEANLADALRQLGYHTAKQLKEPPPEVPAKYDTMDLALAYAEHEKGMAWGTLDHCDGCDLRHSRRQLPEGYVHRCKHSQTAIFGAWFEGCLTCGHIWKRDRPISKVEEDLRQLPF